jgi:hypothetical protein
MLIVTPKNRAIPVPSSQLIDFWNRLRRACQFGFPIWFTDGKTYRNRVRERDVLPAELHHYLLFSTTGKGLGALDTRPFLASSISML